MKSLPCPKTLTIAAFVAVLASTTYLSAQMIREETYDEPTWLDFGRIDNPTDHQRVVVLGTVTSSGGSWMRVHIGDYDLGRASYLTLTALDGQEQRFDARSLPDWYHWSAIFNGDEVEVALHVVPGDTGVFVQIDQVRAPKPPDGGVMPNTIGQVASICNDFDDRGASSDPRVARLRTAGSTNGFCTAWLVSNGAVLSAGHCLIAAGDLIEFNVPGSQANGTNAAASVNNQYPVNAASIQMENNGRGADWVVFAVNPNTNTGLRAHIAQGYFFMTKAGPAIDTTLRVTGYGLDNIPAGPGGAGAPCCDSDGDGNCEFNCNSTSQTQQSTTGRLDDLDGDIIEHDVDTMPANSGSPIIWDGTDGYTIGIHTQGGCDNFWDGYNNHGTRLHRGPLEAALQNFLGPNTVYVDWADVGLPANGGIYEPLHTVSSAVAAVPHGGIIGLIPGFYPRAAGNLFTAGADGKTMTFIAPVGGVVIGN